MYTKTNKQVMFMETRCPIWHTAAGEMFNFIELVGTNNMEEVRKVGLCEAQERRHVCSV